uniref:LRRNT domain-containing protein n=1 Tax=Tetranychus urticae TaxID=32264 RepID=T1KJG7_TETUR
MFNLQVPTKSLEKLTFLVSLHLNYNNIQVLHYGAFRGLISLLRLSLYGNKIKTIDPNVFHGIGGNLTRINLGANQLTSIDSSSFFNLTTLKVNMETSRKCWEIKMNIKWLASLSICKVKT